MRRRRRYYLLLLPLLPLMLMRMCSRDGEERPPGAGPSSDGGPSSSDASLGASSDAQPGGDAPPSGSSGDAGSSGGAVWRPAPGTSWQWQLTGSIDLAPNVTMFDVDLFDVSKSTIDALHEKGRIVICYFSAGSQEDWRPDVGDFPSATVGQPLDNWPGERWVDVRSAAVRKVMTDRLDLAVAKTCDGVEPDNVDMWTRSASESGFPITAANQLDYNRFLAREAHARGLSVGLKNDPEQVPQLVGDFDWALVEECVRWDECEAYSPFVSAGKAVFHVEYTDDGSTAAKVCPVTKPLKFSTLIKKLSLDASRTACP